MTRSLSRCAVVLAPAFGAVDGNGVGDRRSVPRRWRVSRSTVVFESFAEAAHAGRRSGYRLQQSEDRRWAFRHGAATAGAAGDSSTAEACGGAVGRCDRHWTGRGCGVGEWRALDCRSPPDAGLRLAACAACGLCRERQLSGAAVGGVVAARHAAHRPTGDGSTGCSGRRSAATRRTAPTAARVP